MSRSPPEAAYLRGTYIGHERKRREQGIIGAAHDGDLRLSVPFTDHEDDIAPIVTVLPDL
jgi:hypothetical protein